MLARAVDHLRARQAPAGWWKGELRTNVTMDAEDLLLRQFLGILDPADLAAAARWIRSQQRPDGTWSLFEGGPPDLSTTIEAYAALRLAGDTTDSPHLSAARRFVLEQGGLEASRVFTRIWLALFGEWAWDDLPAMPPELVLLPSWVPLNVYDWACWARQTVVPITVVATLQPVRPLPFTLVELRTHTRPRAKPAPTNRRDRLVVTGFEALDRALKTYQRSPIQFGRQTAFRRAAEWIIARQEADGGWGGIQPPWVYSILALHLLGYPLDHPVLKAAIAGLEGFLVRESGPDGEVRRLEACQSPVWDTALAVIGLLDAGVPADDPAVNQAVDWLLGEEVRVRGDWSVRRPGLEPGGWAFEFANDLYPDIDDTAEVVLALHRVLGARPERDAEIRDAIARGARWVTGMQTERDGGWGAFDADNTSTLIAKLPFSDFGAVTDPPSADVTAHVLEMYAALGEAGGRPAGDARRWLLEHQEADGSWFGRWGVNHVYGTGAAVPALVAAGTSPDSAPIRRAVAWLLTHQNPDGGWGEDLRSYDDPAWIGRGTSTASQTAWALLALHAAGETGEPTRRALAWLADTQGADGSWAEDLFTGTGFPGDFYINYEMYRIVFPLAAIGRLQ
ncbi:squalene--hopene cyclase [Jatrophihabitans sp. YIM 134969]